MPRGQSPATIVVASDAADPEERAAYVANANLDPTGKLRITYADLTAFLNLAKNRNRLTYDSARARLALAMRGTRTVARSAAPVIVGVGLLAAAVAWRAR
jgi:hypothetical protein